MLNLISLCLLAAAPLASKGSEFDKGNVYEDLNWNLEYPKTKPGPMWSFLKIKNLVGLVVSEILTDKQGS